MTILVESIVLIAEGGDAGAGCVQSLPHILQLRKVGGRT